MDGVKKETASEITNPPGSGPCRPAHPGLSPYWDGEKIIIPEEIYDGAYWDLIGEAPKLRKVFVIHLSKNHEHKKETAKCSFCGK